MNTNASRTAAPASEIAVWLSKRGSLASGYRKVAVTGEHVNGVGRLPPLHKDPFDRPLIAQARVEGATLLTADAATASYGKPVRFVG